MSAVVLLAAGATAHGNITSPPARLAGPAMQAACGAQAVASVEADGTIPLENLAGALPTCP
jgi:predicted carbohydrate-binding protein with CBM5 and CBM33 domain